jgi:lipopolysaccharide transport system ATP-binding protein
MSSEPEVTIRVDGLSKRYEIYDRPRDRLLQMFMRGRRQYFREFWALRDVSFEIRRGETVGIIGRNGSGKSTLLQLLCGTLNPSAGQLKVHGRVAALLELGAGFNPEFTGRENVFMAAKLLGLTHGQVEERFDSIAAFAEIGEFIEQPVKTYSSGMYVRLAFAVNAHVDADILVIDEALAVGDAFFTQKCMRFLRTFMETGTVLFVSHDTNSVRSLCTKVLWLDKGTLVEQGDAKTVCEHYLEAFIEAHQGSGAISNASSKATKNALKSASINQEEEEAGDFRLDLINSTNLRNDLRLFRFDDSASAFGRGDARIVSVNFIDKAGKPIAWIVGGEDVILQVKVVAHSDLQSPIIGFFIKDRLGQCLFGDNTWLSYMGSPIACRSGQVLSAQFAFRMPRLATGDYSVNVAIADGTQDDHVQHHWIHDALIFKSDSTSVSTGLIGIPMADINLVIAGDS